MKSDAALNSYTKHVFVYAISWNSQSLKRHVGGSVAENVEYM